MVELTDEGVVGSLAAAADAGDFVIGVAQQDEQVLISLLELFVGALDDLNRRLECAGGVEAAGRARARSRGARVERDAERSSELGLPLDEGEVSGLLGDKQAHDQIVTERGPNELAVTQLVQRFLGRAGVRPIESWPGSSRRTCRQGLAWNMPTVGPACSSPPGTADTKQPVGVEVAVWSRGRH